MNSAEQFQESEVVLLTWTRHQQLGITLGASRVSAQCPLYRNIQILFVMTGIQGPGGAVEFLLHL